MESGESTRGIEPPPPDVGSEPDDDARFRAVLGIILGAAVDLLPMLLGSMDIGTWLVASLAGVIVMLPIWRHVGGPLNRPLPILSLVVLFVIGPAIIGRQLGFLAVWTFVGAWAFTLSVLRFATGKWD